MATDSPQPASTPPNSKPPFFEVRSVVILTLGMMTGVIVANLMIAAGHSLAEALVTSLAMGGYTIAASHRLIG